MKKGRLRGEEREIERRAIYKGGKEKGKGKCAHVKALGTAQPLVEGYI